MKDSGARNMLSRYSILSVVARCGSLGTWFVNLRPWLRVRQPQVLSIGSLEMSMAIIVSSVSCIQDYRIGHDDPNDVDSKHANSNGKLCPLLH